MTAANENPDALINELADYVSAIWDREVSQGAGISAGRTGDEQAARELLETVLDYFQTLKITPVPGSGIEVTSSFIEFRKVLRDVLQVDMNNSANRKGALPKALGLVSRKETSNLVIDKVIYWAFEYAKYTLGSNGENPSRKYDDCINLVHQAIGASGKLTPQDFEKLTVENVAIKYHRYVQNIGNN